ERIRLQRRKAEVTGELLLGIDDLAGHRACLPGLGAELLVILRLAHVGVASDDVVSVLVAEDAHQHAGVEPAGIRQYDLVPAHAISLAKRFLICCASRRVGTPRAGAAKMVSSPARVPRHPGSRALSTASATAEAMPGRARNTTSAEFSRKERMVSPSSVSCGLARADTASIS